MEWLEVWKLLQMTMFSWEAFEVDEMPTKASGSERIIKRILETNLMNRNRGEKKERSEK